MNPSTILLLFLTVLASLIFTSQAQHSPQFDEDLSSVEKRQMRNALVRFGRSTGMRNALVRFGKRSPSESLADEIKRNSAPQPFVRFGRSTGGRSIDNWQDPPTLQTLDMPFY